MPFRVDLDAQKQLQAIREFRDQRRHRVAMREWMTTRASRESHRIMLHILVGEAQRRTSTAGSAEGTPLSNAAATTASNDSMDSIDLPASHAVGEHDFGSAIIGGSPDTPRCVTPLIGIGATSSTTSGGAAAVASAPGTLSPQQFAELHTHIDEIMHEQDNYAAALHEIGRLGLFSNRSPGSTPNTSPAKAPLETRQQHQQLRPRFASEAGEATSSPVRVGGRAPERLALSDD